MRSVTATKVARVMAQLDAQGATYRAIPGHPGWYEARWPDDYAETGYARWACRDSADDKERAYAIAFRIRATDEGDAALPRMLPRKHQDEQNGPKIKENGAA